MPESIAHPVLWAKFDEHRREAIRLSQRMLAIEARRRDDGLPPLLSSEAFLAMGMAVAAIDNVRSQIGRDLGVELDAMLEPFSRES